jgi:hypothetical protein
MADDPNQSTLLPPTSTLFPPATPSGLTPNTRSEAEAALTLNTLSQTDSAAPTTPLSENASLDGADEARKAYRRPAGPIRTSSKNYEAALHQYRQQTSGSSNLSGTAEHDGKVGDDGKPVASPVPFPAPGQGVVPLLPSVEQIQAQAQAEAKKARPGLSLAELGRQQSWSAQEYKRIVGAGLLGEVGEGDAGYESAGARRSGEPK